MKWALVTGGVHSGIGKGCVASMLARLAARAGLRVTYQKLEPCLQGELAGLANTHFGEIVKDERGHVHDGDVARAAFYVPGYRPGAAADISLGRLLEDTLRAARGAAAPRLAVEDALLSLVVDADLVVVELGGTAGELEHRIVCEGLLRAWNRPALHAHVTALVRTPSGRLTSKPAQCSLSASTIRPDVVLVRGPLEPEALRSIERAVGRGVVVEPLSDDVAWPERAAARAWRAPRVAPVVRELLGLLPAPEPLLVEPEDATPAGPQVFVLHDGAGEDGYASLAHRLRAWSRGRVRVRWGEDPQGAIGVAGVIRIGERPPAPLGPTPLVPTLSIVPVEASTSPREYSARPDWHGTADMPAGDLVGFIAAVERAARPPARTLQLAYAEPEFAAHYLAASRRGALRDHAHLDRLVARALPAGERLERARILDVGCGAGRWAARLVAAGAREVVGVEPAPPMAAAARALALPRFNLIEGPIESFEPQGFFDAILASMSLDHVEAVGSVLQRLTRHLSHHGRLIVTTEHPLRTAPTDGVRWIDGGDGTRAARVCEYGVEGWRTYHWFGHPAPVRVYHRPLETWVRLLREAGLDLVAVHEPTSDAVRDAGNPRFWVIVAKRPGPMRRLVTIDGPAGSGKTSLGRELARRLEWTCVDSGLLQRAYAWRRHHRREDEEVRLVAIRESTRLLVGGHDVTPELSDEAVGRAASALAEDQAVQRQLSATLDELTADRCVLVGRSWGRFHPDAIARFNLEAPAEVRALRRGCSVAALHERDEADQRRGRLLDPDIEAVILDSAHQGMEALAEQALGIIWTRLVCC